MKICVLNGSPKGDYSVTLQTVLFLQKKFSKDEFNIYNIGQQIKKIEKDPSEVIRGMIDSDLIIFSYPVYTFIATSQVHRFIEIMYPIPSDDTITIRIKTVYRILRTPMK